MSCQGSDSESSSDSDTSSADSEGYDEERGEDERIQCIRDMIDLERQFVQLRETLYRERIQNIEHELEAVMSENSQEYKQRVAQLQSTINTRLDATEILRQFRLANLNTVYDSEEFASKQNFDNERRFVLENLKASTVEKIDRLESLDLEKDINFALLLKPDVSKRKRNDSNSAFPSSSYDFSQTRKRPLMTSAPYIVYEVHESAILDDWMLIQKALKCSSSINP